MNRKHPPTKVGDTFGPFTVTARLPRDRTRLDMDLYVLLRKLRDGGSIVSSAACSAAEITIARAEGRMYVDNDGFGYVYAPSKRVDP